MKKCISCDNEHERRSPCCSTACKQADWRKRQSVTDNESVTPVTLCPGVTEDSVTVKNGPIEQVLHPDIIVSIDAIASSPEDRARDYAQLFTNRPAYSGTGRTEPHEAHALEAT